MTLQISKNLKNMLCVALMTVHKPTQETKNIIASGSIYIYNNHNCMLKLLALEMTNFKRLQLPYLSSSVKGIYLIAWKH